MNEPKELRDALTQILNVCGSMATKKMSDEILDYDLPKTTPKKVKIKIIQEVEKWNEINIKRARKLSQAYDIISNHIKKCQN